MYKALFIDDREMDNLLNSLMVREEKLPLDAVFIPSALEALEYLGDQTEEGFPKFIFIDFHMPLMNGLEFVQAYNERIGGTEKAKNTTLCFLSSFISDNERKDILHLPNVAACYNKPINKALFNELLAKQNSAL